VSVIYNPVRFLNKIETGDKELNHSERHVLCIMLAISVANLVFVHALRSRLSTVSIQQTQIYKHIPQQQTSIYINRN